MTYIIHPIEVQSTRGRKKRPLKVLSHTRTGILHRRHSSFLLPSDYVGCGSTHSLFEVLLRLRVFRMTAVLASLVTVPKRLHFPSAFFAIHISTPLIMWVNRKSNKTHRAAPMPLLAPLWLHRQQPLARLRLLISSLCSFDCLACGVSCGHLALPWSPCLPHIAHHILRGRLIRHSPLGPISNGHLQSG